VKQAGQIYDPWRDKVKVFYFIQSKGKEEKNNGVSSLNNHAFFEIILNDHVSQTKSHVGRSYFLKKLHIPQKA
jgi:hypothetical protein